MQCGSYSAGPVQVMALFSRRRYVGRGTWPVLTPPSQLVFFGSLALAALAVLVHYFGVSIPILSERSFDALALAYVILVVGIVARRL